MKRFLGWDCGNRTLGHIMMVIDPVEVAAAQNGVNTLVEFLGRTLGTEWASIVASGNFSPSDELHTIAEALIGHICAAIKVESVAVKDVLGGTLKENGPEIRAKKLREYLRGANFGPDFIAIEAQPQKIGKCVNSASSGVSHQLAYEYADGVVVFVDPKLKQRFSFGGVKYEDVLAEFMAALPVDTDKKKRDAARYKAGKEHSARMLKYLLGHEEGNPLGGISAGKLNHAGDALFNLLAGIKIHSCAQI